MQKVIFVGKAMAFAGVFVLLANFAARGLGDAYFALGATAYISNVMKYFL